MKNLQKLLKLPNNVLTVGIMAVILGVTAGAAYAITPTSTITSFCTELGNRLGGLSVPNGDVCDVVLVRTTPTITSPTMPGMELNKFTLMNSVIEFTGMSTSSLNTPVANQEVMVMGDFALLESELNVVLPLLASYGWTVTGVHNHMIQETPKLTFVHWETSGHIGSIIDQIRTIISKTTIPAVPPNPTATTTNTGTNTGTSSMVTIAVMKHLCPSTIRSESDIGKQDEFTLCPMVTATSTANSNLDIRFRNTSGQIESLTTPPSIVGGNYEWRVPRSDVTITERAASGTHFGFAEVDSADAGSLISSGGDVINLDTRNDADGRIVVHLFNFRD